MRHVLKDAPGSGKVGPRLAGHVVMLGDAPGGAEVASRYLNRGWSARIAGVHALAGRFPVTRQTAAVR